MLDGTLLCRPLFCERYSWSHRGCRCVMPSGTLSMFTAQYARDCPPMYVLPLHLPSRVSAAALTHRFNRYPRIFVFPMAPPLSYPPHLLPLLPPTSLLATRHPLFFSCHLLTQNHMHISIFWGRGAITCLCNTVFIDVSLWQLYFAFLHDDCQTMLPPVQLHVLSSGVGYHL